MNDCEKKIAVFCGSNQGKISNYTNAAAALGRELASRKIGLVYGGASSGLMGTVASSVIESGGHVTGILPLYLYRRELLMPGLSELLLVPGLSERKQMMGRLVDAVILLPGGIGSLDEFFSIWAEVQLAEKKLPCVIYNVDGYFNSIISFLDKAQSDGFVNAVSRSLVRVCTDVSSCISHIEKLQEAEMA